MSREQGLAPADREGRELDQGIFFWGLLRRPSIGRHLVSTMLLPKRRAQDLLREFRRLGKLNLGTVSIERRGIAAHLTVHNEGCWNAEDSKLADDMETAVDLALLDEQVRVGVLRVGVLRGGPMSHGQYMGIRVFNSGLNLNDLAAGELPLIDFFLRRELGYVNKIYWGVHAGQENLIHFATIRSHG
jgi:thioesterase DpgC